jgi:hypothetical protein
MPLASGTIVYDPRTQEGGREHFDPWWVIVECEARIWEEARARAEAAAGVQLSRPLWAGHISVIGGEEPPHKDRWGHRAGEVIAFEYDDEPATDGSLYWIGVRCEPLADLREALGLARAPRYPFHITLGRKRKRS